MQKYVNLAGEIREGKKKDVRMTSEAVGFRWEIAGDRVRNGRLLDVQVGDG